MKNKYEEFYYENDKNYSVDVYWDLYDVNPQEAIRKYEGHIFCPLCKLAPLAVAKGNELRYMKVVESDMEKHAIWCSYRLEKATKKETEVFYGDLDNADIKNRLVSLLNMMLKKTTAKRDVIGKSSGSECGNRSDFLTIETKAKKKKYLPHKNLYSKSFDTELDVIKMYYGTCALYIYEYIPDGQTEVKKYYLKVLNSNTRKVICDLSISTYVYQYLEESMRAIPKSKEEAQNYYLCFAGCMEKGKYTYSCRLMDSRLIVLEKEE